MAAGSRGCRAPPPCWQSATTSTPSRSRPLAANTQSGAGRRPAERSRHSRVQWPTRPEWTAARAPRSPTKLRSSTLSKMLVA
eukprot:6011573-Prymnesium_polylepis.2